jgi:hypothetical protein
LKVHLHYFSKIKSQRESQNSRNQGFSYYFCMMIEGSGSGSGSILFPSSVTKGWRTNLHADLNFVQANDWRPSCFVETRKIGTGTSTQLLPSNMPKVKSNGVPHAISN